MESKILLRQRRMTIKPYSSQFQEGKPSPVKSGQKIILCCGAGILWRMAARVLLFWKVYAIIKGEIFCDEK